MVGMKSKESARPTTGSSPKQFKTDLLACHLKLYPTKGKINEKIMTGQFTFGK